MRTSSTSTPGGASGEPSNPRARLLAHLAADMAGAAAAGDVEAMRVCHEAIRRLIGAAPRTGEDAGHGAVVVRLDAERERRVAGR